MFQNSSPLAPYPDPDTYFTEVILFPLPRLHCLLFLFAQSNRKSGMKAIGFIIQKRPYQVSQARRALFEIAINDLSTINDFSQLAKAKKIIGFYEKLPEKAIAKGFITGNQYINEIADLVAQYSDFTTFYSRKKQIVTILNRTEEFLKAAAFLKGYSGKGFRKVAASWIELVKNEQKALQKQVEAEPIPNPYVVGNPLRSEDKEVFQGRQDVARILENEIMGGKRISPLLFFGKRRIGKTSTLLNLKKLLGPRVLPVFLDCQDVRVYKSDAGFLYHLLSAIHKEINKQRPPLINFSSLPERNEFEANAFEIFSNLFDDFTYQLESKNHRILLCLDEYERLDRAYSEKRITNDLLDQIRHFIQHQERIVFLFSGSHRMTENDTIRWSDYLINVKTVKLSFLDTKSAEKLITAPLPDWPLTFTPGVADKILRITHCQPYLLQAVASDLVDYLNVQKRFRASMKDLEEAITRVLVTAELYFQNTWEEDLTEEERTIILEYLRKDGNVNTEANKEALHGLVINDIFEIVEERHVFVIDLFKRWILKTQPV